MNAQWSAAGVFKVARQITFPSRNALADDVVRRVSPFVDLVRREVAYVDRHTDVGVAASSHSAVQHRACGRRLHSAKLDVKGHLIVPSRNAAYKAAVTRSAVVPGLNRLAGCRSQESNASSRSRASVTLGPAGVDQLGRATRDLVRPGNARTCARSMSQDAVPVASDRTTRSRFRAASPRSTIRGARATPRREPRETRWHTAARSSRVPPPWP